ncbi:MAG: ABC transporter permease [Ignavibacteriae bacterium]|nr:ABC transporter permease [Ignavibacteriota bacterium]
MTKALVVAKWEYLEKVKSKAFLIGLLVTPVLMLVMGLLPTLLACQEDETTKVIGVIDRTGEIAGPLAARLQNQYKLSNGNLRYLLRPIAVGDDMDFEEAKAEGDTKVLMDEIEGLCIINPSLLGDSLIEYRSKNVADLRTTGRIEESVRAIMLEKKVAALGLQPTVLQELKVNLDVRTVRLSSEGEEESGFTKVFFTAYVFLMMLFFLIFTSGQLLVRSVIEEKSSRIVETLVSSCSPTELMSGKILGLSGLGLTQMGFWALIGAALSLRLGFDFASADQALLLVVYFVLGYLFYAAVFIALGSPVTTEQEAQQISSYLVIFLVLPIALAIPAMQNPNALWIKVLTYVPFFTPTMMALRIPIAMPSVVEVVTTVLIMVAAIYGGMLVAGRIFRVAILATGKRATLAEMVRWARTA